MRGTTSEQRTSFLSFEHVANEPRGALQALDTEACHQQRMPRNADRLQNFAEQRLALPEKRAHQLRPRGAVGLNCRGRLFQAWIQDSGAPVFERVCKRGGRSNPFDAVLVKWQFSEERREDAHRVHRGAYVVDEPRQGNLAAAASSADDILSFQHDDGMSRARERDRGGQPIWSAPHHDSVVRTRHRVIVVRGVRRTC